MSKIRDGEVILFLSVADIAQHNGLQSYVRKAAFVVGSQWPVGRYGSGKVPVVSATIHITDYLTDAVPDKLRTRTLKVKSAGDVLVAAAKMYAKVYAEDEKLGGETVEKRHARLKKKHPGNKKWNASAWGGRSKPLMMNRGFGPYIWGHDIEDLVFEGMYVEWTNNRSCFVTFGIGS